MWNQKDSSKKTITTKRPIPVKDKNGFIELKETFGRIDGGKKPRIVPYYHTIGREASFKQINALIKRPDYGPRTFLRADIHAIVTKTFTELQSEPHIYVYGEGTWGGEYASQRLEPHKTHRDGRFLDIFIDCGIHCSLALEFISH